MVTVILETGIQNVPLALAVINVTLAAGAHSSDEVLGACLLLYWVPLRSHSSRALYLRCGSCEEVFEGPNLSGSNQPAMNCRRTHSEICFNNQPEQVISLHLPAPPCISPASPCSSAAATSFNPEQVKEKSWNRRDVYGEIKIWYHVGDYLDGEWYCRSDKLKA